MDICWFCLLFYSAFPLLGTEPLLLHQPLWIVGTDSNHTPSKEGQGIRPGQSEHQNPLASAIGSTADMWPKTSQSVYFTNLTHSGCFRDRHGTKESWSQGFYSSYALPTRVTKRIGHLNGTAPGHFAMWGRSLSRTEPKLGCVATTWRDAPNADDMARFPRSNYAPSFASGLCNNLSQ